MFPSWMQILLVVLLIVLLFGRGKISDLMGDVAKGIRSFKKGLSEDEDEAAKADEPMKTIADKSDDATKVKKTTASKEKAHS